MIWIFILICIEILLFGIANDLTTLLWTISFTLFGSIFVRQSFYKIRLKNLQAKVIHLNRLKSVKESKKYTAGVFECDAIIARRMTLLTIKNNMTEEEKERIRKEAQKEYDWRMKWYYEYIEKSKENDDEIAKLEEWIEKHKDV